MAISKEVQTTSVSELYLDPQNPRLGRHDIARNLDQDQLLRKMRGWTLDELAQSYIENEGFWTHEALIVVEEDVYDDGDTHLVVVEGNRRLAALKYLYKASNGEHTPGRKWEEFAESLSSGDELFTDVPYLLADSRKDVQAFLGFRHVSGIKPWGADEKAGYIAKLIEEENLSYREVMRKIGSKTPTVREHYIAYRTLIQIEETVDEFEPEYADNRFAVLYMTLRTEGAKQYLSIEVEDDAQLARYPIPDERADELTNFAKWLFGNDSVDPIVTDTRQVLKFGKVLENEESLEYLKTAPRPNLEIAYRRAGGDTDEIVGFLERAADNLESANARAHLYRDLPEIKELVRRVGLSAMRVSSIYDDILAELRRELCGSTVSDNS